MMDYQIRNFCIEDTSELNKVALRAFEEYLSAYSDSSTFEAILGNMAALSKIGEIIIAVAGVKILGAVAYVPSGAPKADFFEKGWPIMRMLVVDPQYRGIGIGHALTEECVNRARRDGNTEIALHTSPIMKVALPMYERMGFQYQYEAPPIFGVPYRVYVKQLHA